jgi:phosphatidylglycerophosphate synthase
MKTNYQSTSRRPIADAFRATARSCTNFCVRHHIHPNTISLGSIVAAAGAGACFVFAASQPWLLVPAVAFCYLRLWMNMLDGMVAIAGGTASRWGEILNDLPDRASDVIIFLGVAHSGLCNPFLAYGVAIAALLVAYVGTFGQAVGAGRQFGGVMSKPWRMVALHAGAWATLFAPGPLWLDWTLIGILVGCVQTAATRLHRIQRALQDDGQPVQTATAVTDELASGT